MKQSHLQSAAAALASACGKALVYAMLLGGAAHAAPSIIEGQDGWLFPGWERSDKVERARLEANLKLVQEVRDQLQTKQIGLVLMVVPAKAAFYQQRLPATTRLSADIQSRYGDIQTLLAKAGIPTFDDRAVLQAVEQGKQTAFYRADYHWTAWAAEASAEATAQLIRTQWRLPAAGGGATLGEWTNDRRYGDLATNFMSPEDRKRIGRDIYTVRKQAEAGANAALLDSAPAQVLVVGNSFVQPYLGYTQKLSNLLDQAVGLTWNPGNVGPWKTLLDALENAEFAQHKTKVIVWQFNEAQLENGPDAADSWDAKGVMSAASWRSRVAAALSR
ncbi:twin-arginine translocation pathway signal [Herbaspirillum sp. RV1423]|uniref:alginate O-acetyltransferase AlgX-related protein n=1 Tax=Herbaspirillum sp. RV1423 TaxID=1443993 RepID=UPI0004B0942D|nr:twin-arginine translocation pathway signal [Herbaspirillum sp. RV1423]